MPSLEPRLITQAAAAADTHGLLPELHFRVAQAGQAVAVAAQAMG